MLAAELVMLRLRNTIQNYAWGSTTALPRLLGREPTGEPMAELWMGAHPRAPSQVETTRGWQGLDAVLAEQPTRLLGDRVAKAFAKKLPFLFKVLASGHPLSLQAHPSLEQAREGFAREDRQGIAIDAPNRNYRDANHKPELLCALEPFEVLCGFAAPSDTLRILEDFAVPELAPLRERLDGDASSLRAAFSWVLGHADPASVLDPLIAAAANPAVAERQRVRTRWVQRLAAAYPGDMGTVAMLLLNHHVLEPGQAIYLGAGQLHAYLEGVGVELMANSDNVLRGGLTPKHVDRVELDRVLHFEPEPLRALAATSDDGVRWVYETPASEFRLARIDLLRSGAQTFAWSARGPEILLCTQGEVRVDAESLRAGESAFLKPGSYALTAAVDSVCYQAAVNWSRDGAGLLR